MTRSLVRGAGTAAALALCTPSAVAQLDWIQRTTGIVPPAREQHVFVSDGDNVILFGGRDGSGRVLADTWRWNGSGWLQLRPMTQPGRRWLHAAVHDTRRNGIVMYGGAGNSNLLDDTWEWYGVDWSRRNATPRPPARANHGLAFDESSTLTVVFGGERATAPQLFDDTWVWDGGAWTHLFPPTTPSARANLAMAYDGNTGDVLLFGGSDASGRLDDTWLFDGTDWRSAGIAPANRPPARWLHTLTWDPARSVVVLVGGEDASGTTLNDVWEWDGSQWTQRMTMTPLPAVARHAAAITPSTGRLTVVTTTGETWDLVDPPTPSFTSFGLGCPSSTGPAPSLVANNGSVPRIGQPFAVDVLNGPDGPNAFVIVGGSNTMFQGSMLPLNLGPFGAPTCNLWIDVVTASPLLTTTAGVASWSPTIPNDPNLIGSTLYAQGVLLDAPANVLGLVVANAGELLIGR